MARLKSGGSSPNSLIDVRFTIEGVDKTSDQFKAVRRDINKRMRDVMVRVGEREVLPAILGAFPRQTGVMASSLKIERERSGVFVGSKLRTGRNRALGWIDFGGKRPNDTHRRQGPHTIVKTLDAKRALIDRRVVEGVTEEFRDKGFDAS